MEENKSIIRDYAEKKKKGIDYSIIRKELLAKGYSKEEISELIKKIDQIVLEEVNIKSTKMGTREVMIIGYILLLVGGFLTVASYYQWINLSGLYIFAWGPVIVGYFMIVMARRSKRRNKQ